MRNEYLNLLVKTEIPFAALYEINHMVDMEYHKYSLIVGSDELSSLVELREQARKMLKMYRNGLNTMSYIRGGRI